MRQRDDAALPLNQTLEGHRGIVNVVCWNEKHERLTSADEHGTILVWATSHGEWKEDMRNEKFARSCIEMRSMECGHWCRNKGKVAGLCWNETWDKICIAYETGQVLVGDIEGLFPAFISSAS